MSLRDRRPALLAVLALVTLSTAACASSDDGGGTEAAATVTVSSTDDACDVDTTKLPAGPHRFAVTNDGSTVTEFYVYGEGDKVIGEVENIAPGLTRELLAELPAGTYQAACKPGMAGDGIRQELTVTGEAAGLAEDASLAQAGTDYQAYVQ